MACNSVSATNLVQDVNRLVQVDYQNALSSGFLQVISTSCNKSANKRPVGDSTHGRS